MLLPKIWYQENCIWYQNTLKIHSVPGSIIDIWKITSCRFAIRRSREYEEQSLVAIVPADVSCMFPYFANNILRPGQNGRHFLDDVLECILNENIWMSIEIFRKFVYNGLMNIIPVLTEIQHWLI